MLCLLSDPCASLQCSLNSEEVNVYIIIIHCSVFSFPVIIFGLTLCLVAIKDEDLLLYQTEQKSQGNIGGAISAVHEPSTAQNYPRLLCTARPPPLHRLPVAPIDQLPRRLRLRSAKRSVDGSIRSASPTSSGSDSRPPQRREAMETPPPFQESAHCDVCSCTFSTFRRRHHCRSCGRTLCHEHSSYHMALPQYGIHTDVRVCYDCFNKSSSHGGVGNASLPGSVSGAADSFSCLNLGNDDASLLTKNSAVQSAAVVECKCGMPLCICEAPKPEPAPVKNITASSTAQSNPRPKKSTSNQQPAESSAKKASTTSSSNSSSFLNLGLMSNDSNDKVLSDYDVNGEGLREAIKSGDVKAAKKLLSQGVDSNYCDKQGFTLLHLAALFNQTEIALILMDNGANVQSKNGQGETPLDCAPAMLQYKMRQKMEELAASQRPE